MRHGRRHAGRGFLFCGGAAIAFGLALGPLINWLLEWDIATSSFIVCIAVGLVLCVCGYGRMNGWSR